MRRYLPDRLVATFPAVVEAEQWHSFEIWVKGSMLLYYLDGKIALIYDKVAIPEGKFGFMNRGSQVYFDDIELFEVE